MDYLLAYQHLRDSLPRAAIAQIQHENSAFCNYVDRVKDCYLITSAWECERCFYSRNLHANLDCTDCIDVHESELCYESVGLKNCYNVNFSIESENCSDCEYIAECKSCQNCFCCTNLRHAKHHIFNKPYPPEKYTQIIHDLKKQEDQNPGFLEFQFEKLRLLSPHIAMHGHNNENSTGDFLFNTQNCKNCYETKECRDLINVNEGFQCEDSVDVHITEFSRWNFDCVSAYKLHNSNFCYNCWESSDLEYCEQCFQCEHCMFCVFQKHKRYRILNKQYSKEEYFKLKTHIITQMKKEDVYGHKHIPSTYPEEDSVTQD